VIYLVIGTHVASSIRAVSTQQGLGLSDWHAGFIMLAARDSPRE